MLPDPSSIIMLHMIKNVFLYTYIASIIAITLGYQEGKNLHFTIHPCLFNYIVMKVFACVQ